MVDQPNGQQRQVGPDEDQRPVALAFQFERCAEHPQADVAGDLRPRVDDSGQLAEVSRRLGRFDAEHRVPQLGGTNDPGDIEEHRVGEVGRRLVADRRREARLRHAWLGAAGEDGNSGASTIGHRAEGTRRVGSVP